MKNIDELRDAAGIYEHGECFVMIIIGRLGFFGIFCSCILFVLEQGSYLVFECRYFCVLLWTAFFVSRFLVFFSGLVCL
ncbi:hypothetical protein BJ165DRAFT_1511990 [Panaeolus papilionaceus]|nr:hypothetical protein BJ165DRAFT_1511990 [Panaeolus papilionaceus]